MILKKKQTKRKKENHRLSTSKCKLVETPSMKSTHAILLNRNKLPFQSLGLSAANGIMVCKSPTTIKTNSNLLTEHNAMPYALKGTILNETVAYSELLFESQ